MRKPKRLTRWIAGLLGVSPLLLSVVILPAILVVSIMAIGIASNGDQDALSAAATSTEDLNRFLAVLKTQQGYVSLDGHRSKYAAAYDENGAKWDAAFISWCARQAEISEDLIPNAVTPDPSSFYLAIDKKTAPMRGDLIFFDLNGDGASDHVGVVLESADGIIVTIEGDTDAKIFGAYNATTGQNISLTGKEDGIVTCHRIDTSGAAAKKYILGYGRPSWAINTVRAPGGADIAAVAKCEVGNVAGEKYWKWYGFSGWVDWCAIFASWCAEQCGYIDANIFPKFAAVNSQGIPWFQDHGLWHSRDYEPYPGDLIFIDWEADGNADHVEIVTKFEKGTVYTVGGNRNGGEGKVIEYSIKANDKRIYGYGTPQYATLLFPVPDCQKVLTEFSANGGIVIGSATKDLTGYKVVAAAAGTIQRIEPADDDSGCVGVVIDHGGDTSTEYRNFRLSPGLKVGDTVNAGDVLGTIYGADPASLTTTRKTTTTQHAATTSRKSTSTTTSRKSTSATSSTSVTSTTSTTSAPRIDPKNVNRISFYLLIDGKRIDPFTKGYLSRPTEEPPKP